jgi:hypothetical protein
MKVLLLIVAASLISSTYAATPDASDPSPGGEIRAPMQRQTGNLSSTTAAKQTAPSQGLKTGMDAIRHAVLALHLDITDSRLDSAGYQRLATSLDQTINTMLKDQAASEKAGKAFHTIVMGDLRWGIDMMRTSPKTDVQRLGALSVFQALRNYGQYFAHPGWDPIP